MNKFAPVFLLAAGITACSGPKEKPKPEGPPVFVENIKVTTSTVEIKLDEMGTHAFGTYREIFDFAAEKRCMVPYLSGYDTVCTPFAQLGETGEARVRHFEPFLEKGPGIYADTLKTRAPKP
jgi:hypothetical protein